MAIADDVLAVIRRLKLGGELDEAVDPAAMRYLGDLGTQERAWYTRFGFDPDSVNPADAGAVGRAARSLDQGVPAAPDMGLESPMFDPLYKATGAYDNLRKGRTPNLRNSGGDLARIAGDNIRRASELAERLKVLRQGFADLPMDAETQGLAPAPVVVAAG